MQKEKYPKRFTVSVMQEDLDNGRKCKSTLCPVALAVTRSFPIARHKVSVSPSSVAFIQGLYRDQVVASYVLPPEAIDLVHQFDRGQAVQPLTFEMILEDRELA